MLWSNNIREGLLIIGYFKATYDTFAPTYLSNFSICSATNIMELLTSDNKPIRITIKNDIFI